MTPGGGGGRDTNANTARLAQLIGEIGPDIPEIARRLGQFKESVRYRYKEKILKQGLAVQAMIDHEKLGLRRIVFTVDFYEDYEPYARPILMAMSDLCYVTGFEQTMPEGSYLVNASVPIEFVDQFTRFFRDLEGRGLFRCSSLTPFDWYRMVPMRAASFDFDAGMWDFDWSNLIRPAKWQHRPSKRCEFDYTDLLILKELRIDAARSWVEIARKLGINYKKMTWHYFTHVKARSLIRGFSVNWMGTRYDFGADRALHRRHRYFRVDLLCENLSEVQRMELMSKTNALPFLWAEAGGRNYWAEFAFPVDSIVEAYQYMMGAIRPVKDRSRLLVLDQTDALSFTVSYRLYDARKRAWTFEREKLLAKFGDLSLKIKQGVG